MKRLRQDFSWEEACAFSRTELLVTLAVAAVLGVMALTLLTSLRSRAKLATCLGNLRQINGAVLHYAADHADKLPDSVDPQQGDLWWWYKEKVKGYLGMSGAATPEDLLFSCPMDRGYSDPRPFCKTARFDYGSYVLNAVALPGVPSLLGWKVPDVRQPARTLLVMEWTAHAPLSWHKSRTGRANAPFYSGAENVVGFVDGHVRFIPIYYDGYNAAYTRDPIPGYEYKFSGN